MRLTLFDLDHTLLDGDSDELWCDFLMDRGVLDRAGFAERNARMVAEYQAGTVGVEDFCGFYVSTLAARRRAQWEPLRREFMDREVAPRIPCASHELVRQHLAGGDLVVMTTATNRFITELTAAHLGVPHLIATECETDAAGEFSGRIAGVANMRAGKLVRLRDWALHRGIDLAACEITAYSDSINDLPLLEAARRPVAVDPEPRLAAVAADRTWPVLALKARAG